jgi:hypothetical protein
LYCSSLCALQGYDKHTPALRRLHALAKDRSSSYRRWSQDEWEVAKQDAAALLEEEIFDREGFLRASEHLKVRKKGFCAPRNTPRSFSCVRSWPRVSFHRQLSLLVSSAFSRLRFRSSYLSFYLCTFLSYLHVSHALAPCF